MDEPFDVRTVIEAAKHRHQVPAEDIERLIAGLLAGSVSEAQAAAWLMAVCCRGVDADQAAALTRAMAEQGGRLDLSGLPHTADKHSTGGVGDKTTLVACPIAAAIGCTVAKMSGRGLGHTGGTIDKLESIPGLRTDLTLDSFLAQAREVGLVISAQTADLAPADKRLYALRNETATVESIPLIAASIMSKKLAAGAETIVLDVKWGTGAFLADRVEARELARLMVRIGEANGRRVAAALSPMGQPLGRAIGHALEVREAVETLRGGGPGDLRTLALALAARMAWLSGAAPDERSAMHHAVEALMSGAAYAKLRAMVAAQGGDVAALEDPARMPAAAIVEPYLSPTRGVVTGVYARKVADALAALGGARVSRDRGPDLAVGIVLARKAGDVVAAGEPLAEIHAATREGLERARLILAEAITVGGPPCEAPDEPVGEWV